MFKYCCGCMAVIPNNSRQWTNKKFCSVKCRKTDHRKKKSLTTRSMQKRSNLLQNEEMLYLINQCRKAKTIQILHGHTLDTFVETMSLVRKRPAGDVNLCHISPIKGKGSTGLFHCLNLFYGGSYQNKKFGNAYLSGGLFINNHQLKDQWRVSNEMSNNDILLAIELFLKDIIVDYIKISPVKKSKKANLAMKISETNPSLRFDDLMFWSYYDLNYEWSKVSGQRAYIVDRQKESKYLAYIDELTRFISYKNKRAKTLKKLRRILVIGYMALERIAASETYNKYFYVKYEPLINLKYGQAMLRNPSDWPEFKDLMYETAFNVMQGAHLDTSRFSKKVMSYLVFPDRAFTIR